MSTVKDKFIKFYLSLKSLRRPKLALLSLKSIRDTRILSNKEHIQKASNWLLLSQENSPEGKGYSRGFYLFKQEGWDKAYIETTGYIIPSLIQAGEYLNDQRFIDSALNAGRWLLSVQKPNGAFTSIDNDTELAFYR